MRHVIRFAASVKRQLQELTARERVLLLQVELSKASKPLSEYARAVQAEPIVVTEDDEPVAVLVSIRGRIANLSP